MQNFCREAVIKCLYGKPKYIREDNIKMDYSYVCKIYETLILLFSRYVC